MTDEERHLVYKDGAVDIPSMHTTLAKVFGAALHGHDIMQKGRLVNITLKGVKIGQIQLKDDIYKQVPNDPTIVRKNPRRI